MHKGHRQRMRERFLKTGLAGFADHEILELVLFYAIPRKDTNPIAHRLIKRFGSLKGVLSADIADLSAVEGVGDSAALLLRLFADISRLYMTPETKGAVLDTAKKAADYLWPRFMGLSNEEAHLICLDTRYRIIHEELIAQGCLSAVPVFPRKIVALALQHDAASVILTHNHPGDDPQPSKADVETTLDVSKALGAVDIALSDHIIMGADRYYSFSDNTTHVLERPQPRLRLVAEDAIPFPIEEEHSLDR
ncbi:MAG: RadC family protein [Christensenellaceae bacterium]|nr:RadC family protein [Christensenellaceae bacterium]